MDKTLKNKKAGHATVEYLLLLPIFICILGYSNMLGAVSRVFTYSNSVGADMLSYMNSNEYNQFVFNRTTGSKHTETEIIKMWKLNNPDADVTVTVMSLPSPGDSYTDVGLTTQNGINYVGDRYSLAEERERAGIRIHTSYDPETGEVTIIESTTEEGKWMETYAGIYDYLPVSELMNGRSVNRSIDFEVKGEPWMKDFLPGETEHLNANYDQSNFSLTQNVSSYRHFRDPFLSSTSEKMFDDTDPGGFHNAVLNLLGEDENIVEPTGYQDTLKEFQSNEALSPN